ncbi:DUF3450 domain-containing protein [Planctomycetales bacterium ZRK34]|nr:DUF3450 domain-containing protein [Planctomycetales bacterium ZRK34]
MINMTDVMRKVLLAICLLAAAAPAQSTSNDALRDELAKQVHEKLEALAAMRAERRRAQQLHDEQVAELDRQITRLDADMQQAAESLEREQAAQTEQQNRLEFASRRVESARQWVQQFNTLAEPLMRHVADRIQHGIAYDRQARLGPVQQAVDELADASASPRQASTITTALQRVADDLIAAQRIELANQAIMLDNPTRRVDVWRLRLGLAGELFISEDGQMRGLGSGRIWRTSLSPATAEQIDDVFSIVQEKQPPQLIGVPLEPSPATRGGRQP